MAQALDQEIATQSAASTSLFQPQTTHECGATPADCSGPIAEGSIVDCASQQQLPPAYTLEFLLKAAARQGRRLPDTAEQQKKLLSKLTHLHMNGLQLQALNSIKMCPNIQVLYLYDNQLTSISNISSNRLITHIYLQNNQLQTLDGLQHLPLLEKLYLQSNKLSVISGLEAASRLEELHVSDQHFDHLQQQQQQHQQLSTVPMIQQQELCQQLQQLQAAQQEENAAAVAAVDPALHEQHQDLVHTGGLAFERASLQAISSSLRVLAASNCHIRDPTPLQVLSNLRQLDLSHNHIQQTEALQLMLQSMQQLRSLDLQGNPCARNVRHRDGIILLAVDCLSTLDGEPIPASHRAFLLGLHLNKLRSHASAKQQEQQCPEAQQQQQQAGMLAGSRRQLQQRAEAAAAKVRCASKGRDSAALAPGLIQPAVTSSLGLSGTGVRLHPCKAPAARPPGVAGFCAKAMREGAVLGPAASEWADKRHTVQGRQAEEDG